MPSLLRRAVRAIVTTIVVGFALYGAFLASAHIMLTNGWTTESGVIDANSNTYEELHAKYGADFRTDSAAQREHRYEVLDRIRLLYTVRPINADHILRAYMQSGDARLALRMLDAVDRYLISDPTYAARLQQLAQDRASITSDTSKQSVFAWMNIDEWGYLKEGIVKHKRWIDSAALASGVEVRLIVTCLVGEQIRKINTRREMYKGLVAPLKSLSFSTAFSYGVTGIKESKRESFVPNSRSLRINGLLQWLRWLKHITRASRRNTISLCASLSDQCKEARSFTVWMVALSYSDPVPITLGARRKETPPSTRRSSRTRRRSTQTSRGRR